MKKLKPGQCACGSFWSGFPACPNCGRSKDGKKPMVPTEGAWEVLEELDGVYAGTKTCIYAGHTFVAMTTKQDGRGGVPTMEEAEANAIIISALPDLLKACKKAKKYLEADLVEPGASVFWELVRAIKKAGDADWTEQSGAKAKGKA